MKWTVDASEMRLEDCDKGSRRADRVMLEEIGNQHDFGIGDEWDMSKWSCVVRKKGWRGIVSTKLRNPEDLEYGISSRCDITDIHIDIHTDSEKGR
jgi:hypothetical protein